MRKLRWGQDVERESRGRRDTGPVKKRSWLRLGQELDTESRRESEKVVEV